MATTSTRKALGKDLIRLAGSRAVFTAPEDLYAFQSDATHYFARNIPDAVVLPEDTDAASAVLAYAYEHEIPVTPRGAGSGLSGGCTPVAGGIVLDTKRLNRILGINRGNMTARVQAGVVLEDFHRAVEKQGLFYPPDPQSMSVCTLGGNVATRAGGPRAVKYGTTGNYVLGVEAVLADGSVIQAGSDCVKQSVGYDLTHLFTGSEGTLGLVTRVSVRLLPKPTHRRTALVVCETPDQAAQVVSGIIAAGAVPAMLEYVPQAALSLMNSIIRPPVAAQGEAYLLMELDGTEARVAEEAEILRSMALDLGAEEVRIVEDEREAATYWKARSRLYPMILTMAKKVISEDVTVPRDRIPEFVRAVAEISGRLGILIGLGGHAGDGNMHPTILFTDLSPEMEQKAEAAIEDIVKKGLELGGTISGEHGIGLHKSRFLEWELGRAQLTAMKRIKAALDPKGIMNPGKLWT
ncbi:MAG: FAD-binding protein [Deltaproteobacteria bacterium]|nr:FAD-binding protein [Deltaproteobacteria bacterium]